MRFRNICFVLFASACVVSGSKHRVYSPLRKSTLRATVPSRRRLQQTPGFDLVFIVDESGSMSSYQAAIRNNVVTIFNGLAAQTTNSKVGLVGYGGGSSSTGDHPYLSHIHTHTPLTDDLATFQTAANNLVITGGTEPGFEAIARTVEDDVIAGGHLMGFRPNQGFCIVIVTDEDSDAESGYTQARAIDSMLNTPSTYTPNEANAPGVLFAVTNPAGSSSYKPIADATGGDVFNLSALTGDPAPFLTTLITACNVAINSITLAPLNSQLNVGDTLSLVATVIDHNLMPVPNVLVTFDVLSGGVHYPLTATDTTVANGEAVWNMVGTNIGIDSIQACFDDGGTKRCSSPAQVEWIGVVNNPPCAKCKDVIVNADENCEGCVTPSDVNDGSTDDEDDAMQPPLQLALSLNKQCPFELGDTTVELTVTDSGGLTSTCTATVTVVDKTDPTALCNSPSTIVPPDALITFEASAEDNCGATAEVISYDCYDYTKKGKRIDKTESCVVSFAGPSVNIIDSGGVGDNIEWIVRATDGAGNYDEAKCTVEVVNPGQNLRHMA